MFLSTTKVSRKHIFSFIQFISFFGLLPLLSGIYFLHYIYSFGITIINNFYFYFFANALIGLGCVVLLLTIIKSHKTSIRKTLSSGQFIKYVLYMAFLIRICWILLVNVYPANDGVVYYQSAIDISLGKGYLLGGVPTAYWPVGFSAFIGFLFYVFGQTWFILKIFNVVLSIGIILICYLITKKLHSSEQAARIVLLLLAFYPNHIAYTSLFMSEILFTFLLMSGIYLLYRLLDHNKSNVIVIMCGIAFALACYVRPQALFVPFIIIFVTLVLKRMKFWKQHLTIMLKLAVVMIITFTPWTVRNYQLFHAPTFISTNGGINLYIGNNPFANGGYEEVGFNTFYKEHGIEVARSPEFEIKIDKMLSAGAIEFIKTHPVEAAVLWIKKFIFLYADDVDGLHTNNGGIIPKKMKASELENIYNTLNEQDKNVLMSSYHRNPITPHYLIKSDLSNEQIIKVSSLLKAHGYTNKLTAPYSFLYYIFQMYYAFILILFLFSIVYLFYKKQFINHIHIYGLILYFSLLGLAFVALPRYHFSIMPLMIISSSIFLSHRLDTSIKSESQV